MKKNIQLKSIVAAAITMVALHAYAAPITVNAGETYSYEGNNYAYTGTATVNLSEDVMGVFELASVVVSTSGPASYTPPSASVPLTSLSIDSSTRQISSLGTIGGAVLTIPKSGVSKTGGNVVLSNITFDVASRTVFADLTGTNGVGSVAHMAAFTAKSITGTTLLQDNSFVTTANNWEPRPEALAFLTQAMGLNKVGTSALAALTDFGSANIAVTVTPVPESSTYAMTLVGLIGVGVLRRGQMRRRLSA